MDLMYLPDAFTFHVIRSSAHDSREPGDYVEACRRRGSKEEEGRRRRHGSGGDKASPRDAAAGEHNRAQRKGSSGSDSCPMCRERKRRTLAAYIRTKSRQDSETTIEEEDGEEGPPEEGNPATEPRECAA